MVRGQHCIAFAAGESVPEHCNSDSVDGGACGTNLPDDAVSVHAVSCKTGQGMEDALASVHKCVEAATGASAAGVPMLTRPRHRHHLSLCAAGLRRFLEEERTVDIAGEQLRVALRQLGAITGSVGVEEMLETLFKDFCIGK
jgi:tRNA modification GTPase